VTSDISHIRKSGIGLNLFCKVRFPYGRVSSEVDMDILASKFQRTMEKTVEPMVKRAFAQGRRRGRSIGTSIFIRNRYFKF